MKSILLKVLEFNKPFAENISYIYDKAKAMSLDNYTTKNIFHNSKTSGVEGLSTFHEKEKITLHDTIRMFMNLQGLN